MSVAIRSITRIADADDAPALGAGQTGYALTWNNATGAFVATPLFSGGLLATGTVSGATSQAQAFTLGVNLGGLVVSGDTADNLLVNAVDNTIGTLTNINVISGGGSAGFPNRIGYAGKPTGTDETPLDWTEDTDYVVGSASVATICGGYDHIQNQLAGVIMGGGHNFVKYNANGHSIIGGGSYNLISAARSGIFSGRANTITGVLSQQCFIGGGVDNNIVGSFSAILGGLSNAVNGSYSMAFGRRAKANASGVIALSDSENAEFAVATANVFGARYAGGYWLTGGPVGIGSTAPGSRLYVVDTIDNSTVEPKVDTTGLRIINNNAAIGTKIWLGFGFTGSAFGGDYRYIGAIGTDNNKTDIVMGRQHSGDAAFEEHLRIEYRGNVGIGSAVPAAKLHVVQGSGTAAIPVLTLQQSDVSEEFMRFVGLSTTDATRSLVDAADMETPGAVVGWLKIYVQDDQATNPITDGYYYVPFYTAPTHSA